ncbi:DUF86 domain-containing protein [Candidatus Peregrinibacteria bacterium]|jgi:nucleotidyltransferase substrate binding protein (TIGR01987 family)|nr:DUF86 domain-containing protein [Candidatus Peregrinibacteria bacterium]
MEKVKIQFQQYKKALQKFRSAFSLGDDEIVRDGTIQRFEFTFELSWKIMKEINKIHGMETNSPRDSIKQAYQLKFIDNDLSWLKSLEYRNIISHTYSEEAANDIYNHCKEFLPLFERLEKSIEKFLTEK